MELTVALLRVFGPPTDKIVWDTSHQTYAYKLLTERKHLMDTLRQYEGLSGFLNREESPYDAFGAGHAGTAISAALGMAVARDVHKLNHHVLAVVGDASMGNGISFEALNNLSGATNRMIVVLNDNEMSISANVGALSQHLGGLLANPRYNRWKRSVERFARRMHMGFLSKTYHRVEEALKSLFLRSVIFEELGLRYIGPVDGHNAHALQDALRVARDSSRPILLHVNTTKGKGYAFAEDDQEKWHGTPKFEIDSGERAASRGTSYSKVFGDTMVRLGTANPNIVAITAAMPSGTGLTAFAEKFPDRFHDVGISEEHAAVFAAGMATAGLRPVFAVYSTFLQRAVDGVIHDIGLQGLPVTLCLDRAGVVGDDGPTHHGVFDIALLRAIPGLTIMQPRHEAELANMLYTATTLEGPAVIRYPRGGGTGEAIPDSFEALPIGKAEPLSAGADAVIWALGDMVPLAEDAADRLATRGLSVGVVNARFIRPLDEERLRRDFADVDLIVTIENGVRKGGFGESVIAFGEEAGYKGRILNLGWPDAYVPHGPQDLLMDNAGLTGVQIAKTMSVLL